MFHRLVVTAVQGTPTEHVFALEREVVLVGRRPGVDVLLPHPAVGGVHLRLERDGTRVIAIDAGAKSGTRRRGQPLRAGERIPLEDGDELEIAGVFRARFQARASSAALPTVHQTTHELARTMVHELLGRGESAHLAVRAGPATGGRFSLPPPRTARGWGGSASPAAPSGRFGPATRSGSVRPHSFTTIRSSGT